MAFTANAQSILKGDVNGDGEVNVTDVTMIVEYVMGQHNSNFIADNADANGDGSITITDITEVVNLILGGDITQVYLTCPDDHHPHMIDLGLPSGTKWACCNVGADKPEAYGGHYAWGEMEEKDGYDHVTYLYATGVDKDGNGWYDYDIEFQNLGSDIAGSQYDVAHMKWGGSWVMPSKDQMDELLANCTSTCTTLNGKYGRLFTGTNGGSIFLPEGGIGIGCDLFYGIQGYYWSSTLYPSDSNYAYCMNFGSSYAGRYFGGRYNGDTVRPVSR